jgi:hypothetical protein
MPFRTPMTPERVLFGLYGKIDLDPSKLNLVDSEKIAQK